MKRLLLILGILILSQAGTAREVWNLDRGWKFYFDSDVSSDRAAMVSLPHTWNSDALAGLANYYRGTGYYQREIDIPQSWSGKRIFIKSYGANSVANLYVNGRHAGEHRGGYNAFALEITDLLHFGKSNTLLISVSNAHRPDVLPAAGDATSYGGLIRGLELIVAGKDMIALSDYGSQGVYVHQKTVSRDRVVAEAMVRLSGSKDNNVQVVADILDDKMEVVASQNARVKLAGPSVLSSVRLPFTVDSPRLWNGRQDPYLYTVSVKVLNSGKVVDSIGLRIGFRSVAVEQGRGFMLNGAPLRINGVTVTQDHPSVGTAIRQFHIEDDISLINEIGANAVRTLGLSHHPAFYEACDREGILVWSDMPFTGAKYLTDIPFTDMPTFRENAMAQALETVCQQFNHPSVVMWGIFSDQSMRGDDPVALIRSINDAVKKQDPSRPTVASSNEDGDINFITDLIVWDHYLGWREGKPSDINIWKSHYKIRWDNLRSAVTYSAGASIYHQGDTLARPDFMGTWHPERWQTHFHEVYFQSLAADSMFWGIFAGNLFDYGAAERQWGDAGGINDAGMVTFDRKWRKDAFYLYKANWNHDQPFVHIAEKRWSERRRRRQTIRVYSNMDIVDLVVNGQPQGAVAGTDGIFVWEDVMLEEGTNVVEAVSGKLSDRARIQCGRSIVRHL